ncbi:hypothetical protein L596_025334 [Steinernema carpocapsae]|uniref:Uncharacterized protein n=1 Tax=Steinernema carpocapsae TaxID=34508 RepID=A0A4U5M7G6_STECR|nr:hypothetical protein L596_025334 [Steinernema carpocapsae]
MNISTVLVFLTLVALTFAGPAHPSSSDDSDLETLFSNLFIPETFASLKETSMTTKANCYWTRCYPFLVTDMCMSTHKLVKWEFCEKKIYKKDLCCRYD